MFLYHLSNNSFNDFMAVIRKPFVVSKRRLRLTQKQVIELAKRKALRTALVAEGRARNSKLEKN